MYSFSCSRAKGFMKKPGIAGLVVMLTIVMLTALGSCTTDPIDDTNYPGTLPPSLTGTWESGYDSYIIGENIIEYDDGGWGYSFKGNIEFVSNYSLDSGIIIIKYNDRPVLYTASYYRDLGSNTVMLANVITLSDYSSADTATLDEAITKFTKGSMGKYVDWGFVNPQIKVTP